MNDLQLFIKTNNNKTIIIECNYSSTIMDIKELISNKLLIPYKYYYLTYNGKILNNNKMISDYNITDDLTLYMHIRHSI